MKILKVLLGIVVIVLLIGLVLSLVGPKNYKVERSKVIDAPASIVFNQFGKFSHWDAWSPWKEKDPSAQYKVEGEDGTVGAKYSWFGGQPDITGTGSMVIKEVLPNQKMIYDLAFSEPWEMQSTGGFIIEAIDSNRTKLSWHDEGDIPFGQRAIMTFMNLDEMMGPDFERGLDKIDSMSHIEMGAMMIEPISASN